MRTLRAVILLALSLSLHTQAQEKPKLKGSKKESTPKLDLTLPTFNSIPKDQKLESKEAIAEPQLAPSAPRAEEGYSMVRVVHGKSFVRGPGGAKPASPMLEVTIFGDPPMTEKFSSIVRVKSPAKRNASIDVVILDPLGHELMDASGELRFGESTETEWQVDWEPTHVRSGGEYQVLVRVARVPLGTFPLKLTRAEK